MAIQNNSVLPQFSLSILKTKEGGTLRELTPDSKGVYHGLPVMIFNRSSRNNVMYDTNSILESMNNPTMKFKMSIDEGNLRGEYGHPDIQGTDELSRRRLLKIDEKCVSHAFVSLDPKSLKDGDLALVASIVPAGPYYEAFKRDMDNPVINKSFSLRALCAKPEFVNGVIYKKVLIFVTFDFVNMPGYEKASTRFAIAATEEMEYLLSADQLVKTDGFCDLVGVETITSQKFLDLLKTDQLQVEHHFRGFIDREKGCVVTPEGEVSLFRSVFDY